jgi:tRNA nucleotidyltransferase (CCA-adding enzyme)
MVQKGFIPVGDDFPVFLHPHTKEEYALARTERKSGRGYKGFVFYTGQDVTLEEDLSRRDLTINAIAQTPNGQLVDPLNGFSDIQKRVLRHIGEAFCEDPVRLLRLARFAARFTQFSIAPETLKLARRLVTDGEVDALVPERVWREVSRGLISAAPYRMFDILAETGALERVMPGLNFDGVARRNLQCAAQRCLPLPSCAALLCFSSGHPEMVLQAVKAPSQCADYARLLPAVTSRLGLAQTADDYLALIEYCDGLRKPERFLDLVAAACCIDKGLSDAEANMPRLWAARLDAARSVNGGLIARQYQGQPQAIKKAVRQARLAALASM